jgi:hypothetical protein
MAKRVLATAVEMMKHRGRQRRVQVRRTNADSRNGMAVLICVVSDHRMESQVGDGNRLDDAWGSVGRDWQKFVMVGRWWTRWQG